MQQLNGQQTVRIRKRIIKTFKSFGFKIKIMTNLLEVNFLNATWFKNEHMSAIQKAKQHPKLYTYVVKSSTWNFKRLPTSISELLSLKKSGYQASPEYIEPKVDNIENNTNKLKRKRKIISFNRPFNKVLQPIWV